MNAKTFSFPKQHKLKGQKVIQTLFQSGKAFFVKPFKVVYELDAADQAQLKVAFAVPKKNFKKAVDRNLLKRRLREAFRLNQQTLHNSVYSKNLNLQFVIVYNANDKMSFQLIEEKVKKILAQLQQFADA